MLLRAHNKPTYDNMSELFDKHNRIAAVQPTGTGKSYLIMQLVSDNAAKHFVICSPSVYIFSQLQAIAKKYDISLENVTFVTYTKLSQMTGRDMIDLYADFIVLDEFHRCGAVEWQRGVEDLLSLNDNAKVLGTSATPIRYLDSGRNMAEELFGGVYAVNMSLAEAIRKKILPLPVYVTSWYSFRGDIEQLEMCAKQTGNPRLKHVLMGKIQKAKSMIAELDVGIERIFEKHITDKNGKYIVFCPNVEQLKNMLSECSEWFENVNKNLHKYAVFSASAESDKQFVEFRFDKDKNALKLLFCVDMLNEGVHFDDIDGVIMLRATKSANVFYQQLGRALACSERRSHPVIFDLVNNYETGDTAQQYASIMEIAKTDNEYSDNIEFELYDYVRDIREILTELNDTFSNSWEFNFGLLKEYKDKTGSFPESNTKYEGVFIGKWAQNQRQLYIQGKLLKSRIDALNEIGFPWNVNDSNWESAFNEIRLLSQKLGHFPKKIDIPDEKKYLTTWINTQRSKYRNGTLDSDKSERLKAIGCRLVINSSVSWEDRFEQLKAFVESNRRFPEHADRQISKQYKELSTWVNSQRGKYAKGTISDEQKEKLEAIGFEWNKQDAEWNRQFELLKAYYTEHGTLPKAKMVVDGVKLCRWHQAQMRAYQSGQLSAERIQKFKDAGIPFTSRNDVRKLEAWKTNYDSYVRFMKLFGRKPGNGELYEGRDLYKWSYDQVYKIRKNKLTSEQVSKLKTIGVTAQGR